MLLRQFARRCFTTQKRVSISEVPSIKEFMATPSKDQPEIPLESELGTQMRQYIENQ